jgi:hypothetical protein
MVSCLEVQEAINISDSAIAQIDFIFGGVIEINSKIKIQRSKLQIKIQNRGLLK